MAGLEGLASIIYHEKQQPGSMLCAQHALNSLLQGNYYSAPDLSNIASNLDALEESYDDANTGRTSQNMDDTGFFSVQVIENALNVWGLSAVRWRSEQMRPYQDHPHTQLAFILNLEQHWFTLRRFGHAEPSMDADQGDGHWFNLNSFLTTPEWVGKLYLGMVLQQAESEGYSVFAVVQTDPAGPLALNRTEADEVASTLPEPSHSSSSSTAPRLSTARDPANPGVSVPGAGTKIEGFEDEDMELQAALQASLTGASGLPADFVLPPSARSFPPPTRSDSGPGSGVPTPTQSSLPPMPDLPPLGFPPPRRQTQQAEEYDPNDPVAASMARNRMIMERMRREQEMALQEQYEEEAARVSAGAAGANTRARAGTRPQRSRAEEEEEEMIRRAIEESQAIAEGASITANPNAPLVIDDQDEDSEEREVNEEMDVDSDNENDYRPPPPLVSSAQLPTQPLVYPSHRVYDDDDEELQAALKASLENVPDGFTVPDIPPLPAVPIPVPSVPAVSAPPLRRSDTLNSDAASEASTATSTETSQAEEKEEEKISVDEVRRRRLARFGG